MAGALYLMVIGLVKALGPVRKDIDREARVVGEYEDPDVERETMYCSKCGGDEPHDVFYYPIERVTDYECFTCGSVWVR